MTYNVFGGTLNLAQSINPSGIHLQRVNSNDNGTVGPSVESALHNILIS